MARQTDSIKVQKTRGDQGVWYKMGDDFFIRGMSSLSKETVLTHPRFESTRAYACNFRIAIKLALRTFRRLHSTWKIEEVRSKLTTIAFQCMNAGDDPENIPEILAQFLATCGYSPHIVFDTVPDSDAAAMTALRKAIKNARRSARRKAQLEAKKRVAVIPVVEKPVRKKQLRIANISRKGAKTQVNTGAATKTQRRFACGNTGIHKSARGRKGKPNAPV